MRVGVMGGRSDSASNLELLILAAGAGEADDEVEFTGEFAARGSTGFKSQPAALAWTLSQI